MFTLEWWVALIIGVVVGAFLTPIVAELLPIDNLRFRVLYLRKRVAKYIHSPTVHVRMTVKTPDLSNQALLLDMVSKKLEEAILSHHLKPTISNGEIGFTYEVANTALEVIFRIVTVPMNQVLIVSQLEAEISNRFSYREFDKRMIELIEVSHVAEDYLRVFTTEEFGERLLECKLSSVYQLTGLLREHNVNQLSASLGGAYEFELSRGGVVIYAQRVIESNILSFLRKLIVLYY